MTTRYCIANLDTGLDEAQTSIHIRLAKRLGLQDAGISDLTLVRRALDARKKSNIHFVCSYEFTTASPLTEKLVGDPAMQLRVIQASALDAPALPVKQINERHAISAFIRKTLIIGVVVLNS